MSDIVDRDTRTRIMSKIRGKDTKIELAIRRRLYGEGFRYRLHDRRLSGHPDIVVLKYYALILVHGCFWHGHDCGLFRWPKTHSTFWRRKILGNRARDRRHLQWYARNGWMVATVWECALRGKDEATLDRIGGRLAWWLEHGRKDLTIPKVEKRPRHS